MATAIHFQCACTCARAGSARSAGEWPRRPWSAPPPRLSHAPAPLHPHGTCNSVPPSPFERGGAPGAQAPWPSQQSVGIRYLAASTREPGARSTAPSPDRDPAHVVAYGLLAMTMCLHSMISCASLFSVCRGSVQVTFSAFVVAYGVAPIEPPSSSFYSPVCAILPGPVRIQTTLPCAVRQGKRRAAVPIAARPG